MRHVAAGPSLVAFISVGRMKGKIPGMPAFLHKPLIRFIFTRLFNYSAVLLKMKGMLENQTEVNPPPVAGKQPAVA